MRTDQNPTWTALLDILRRGLSKKGVRQMRHVEMQRLKVELQHAYQNFNYSTTVEETNQAINDMILVERKIKRLLRGAKDNARRYVFGEYLSVSGNISNFSSNIVDYGAIQHVQATQDQKESEGVVYSSRGAKVC